MPYNTTAIPPRKEVTGQTQLPLTRVKKIICLDPDVALCSNNAAFAITLATELFIQYLAQEAQKMTKLERKPRRNIQYKDLANAVLHQDNLEFLEDIIPKTTPYKKIKDQAAGTRARVAGRNDAELGPVGGGSKEHVLLNGKGNETENGTRGGQELLESSPRAPGRGQEEKLLVEDGDVDMSE